MSPRTTTVYLDMDGVIADFHRAAWDAHGLADPLAACPERRGPAAWDSFSYYRMTAEEFWRPLRSATFWAEIPPTAEAGGIVELLQERFADSRIEVLTSAAAGHACRRGKRAWLKAHYPQLGTAGRLHFCAGKSGEAKAAFARPGAVLIDDHEPNTIAFEAAGGRAWLCPRPWNSQWPREVCLLEDLEQYLDTLPR